MATTTPSIVESARTPTPDYAAQAQQIYKDTFGREGDADGVNYWAGKLAGGASVADVTGQVKEAAKGVYQNYLTNPSAYSPEIQGVLAKDLQAGATPGSVQGGSTQELVRNGVNPTIYQNLYGADQQTQPKPTANVPGGAAMPASQASTYQAAQLGTPTQWNVTPEQTVEGRINNILNSDSPIVQMARTRAKEAANERGLLNSSMAVEAGEAAAYGAAVPIATADAATAAKAAGYNADQSNQFDVRNVDATNQASQFNAGAKNTLTGQKLASDTALEQSRISADTQLKTANISAQTQRTIAELEAQTRTDLGYLDAQTKTNLAQLDSGTRTTLATIEANYKGLMQSNASASDLYRQVTQNITNISLSKDMDGPAKQTAVNNQIQLLQNGMSINGAISNLNLGDLLNFSVNATPAATAAPTPAAPVQPSYTGGDGGGV